MKSRLRRIIAAQLESRVKKLIKQNDLKIVAVTGSVGKTSTKLAIAKVLAQKYKVLVHPGNFNSEIGLPLSIFELDVPSDLINPIGWLDILGQIDRKLKHEKYPYEVLVLELGADQPGDIKKFMRYLRPDVGIITAIEPAHLEQFGTLDAIAREKMMLAYGSKKVLANIDNKRVKKEIEVLKHFCTYGLAAGDYHAGKLASIKSGGISTVFSLQQGKVKIRTSLIGRHSLYALIAAAAVAEQMGLTHKQIASGVAEYKPAPGRMSSLSGVNGSLIIDDTYNSSPAAAIAAVQTLDEFSGRKIAILGSMNELGDYTEQGHRLVGQHCAELDLLITIGNNANDFLAPAAQNAGMPAESIQRTNSPYAAGELLRPLLRDGDVVLAKGSQNGVFAEEAVAILLADPKDKSKLVRQGQVWQDKKRKQFEN